MQKSAWLQKPHSLPLIGKAPWRLLKIAAMAALFAVAGATVAYAQDGPTVEEVAYAIDNLVLFICAVLVIFMQAGFAMVEAGLNEKKNTVNILFKNLIDMCIGIVLYYFVGYGLMYPGTFNGFIGFSGAGLADLGLGFAIPDAALNELAAPRSLQVDWLFQVAFAATAATIVSGSVAGRLQFRSYLVYTVIITGLVYPISGSWVWGIGWLAGMGFADFAGSIVVHSVSGFAGLAGAIALGPRIGKFRADGSAVDMPTSNLGFATLGVFILLVGWYGFNPGSQLVFVGAFNTNATLLVATNTTLAAGAGGVMTLIASWIISGKPKLGVTLNGVLAGLVGITAPCYAVTNTESVLIGLIAGLLVIGGMKLLDALKIDDPVGAWPVHSLCGMWGGISLGIFGLPTVSLAGVPTTLGVQLLGSVVIPIWSLVTMLLVFYGLKAIGWLRVSEAEEHEGLDAGEHGEEAYAWEPIGA